MQKHWIFFTPGLLLLGELLEVPLDNPISLIRDGYRDSMISRIMRFTFGAAVRKNFSFYLIQPNVIFITNLYKIQAYVRSKRLRITSYNQYTILDGYSQ